MYKYTAPFFKGTAFNCPYCNAFARMTWQAMNPASDDLYLYRSKCSHCDKACCWQALDWDSDIEMWVNAVMIIPDGSAAPIAHPEMPADVMRDYQEARDIVSRSPRGAAALLRLAVQKLCVAVGESSGTIDKDIKSLVSKGLPMGIQQALDVVRVVGNNAVHPGELTEEDIAEVAGSLFELVNAIVEDRIARPKALEALYQRLPEGARKAIEKRDGQ